jgi:hypothetical protein
MRGDGIFDSARICTAARWIPKFGTAGGLPVRVRWALSPGDTERIFDAELRDTQQELVIIAVTYLVQFHPMHALHRMVCASSLAHSSLA